MWHRDVSPWQFLDGIVQGFLNWTPLSAAAVSPRLFMVVPSAGRVQVSAATEHWQCIEASDDFQGIILRQTTWFQQFGIRSCSSLTPLVNQVGPVGWRLRRAFSDPVPVRARGHLIVHHALLRQSRAASVITPLWIDDRARHGELAWRGPWSRLRHARSHSTNLPAFR